MDAKKWWYLIVIVAAVLIIGNVNNFVGGDVSNVQTEIIGNSLFYDEKEVKKAIDTVIAYFDINFSNCKMTKIWFDANYGEYGHYSDDERYSGQEMIVILSDFDVGPKGYEGGFNPNSTYNNWQWILVRTSPLSPWKLVGWGYG